MALLHVNFFSNALGMCMNMDVILPQTTTGQIGMEGKAAETYPTLYLLHGASDDHTIWQRRTSIERYATEYGIAVVMPTVHLSSYTDMKYGLPYFTYVAKELPQICREFFPKMSPRREDTFVAGLSMGAYGALKCGLVCPETFSKAAGLSGGAHNLNRLKNLDPAKGGRMFDIFGSYEEAVNTENDLRYMAKLRMENDGPRADLYQWYGTEDGGYQSNLDFVAYMKEIGYPFEYHESEGDHSWKYWDEHIQNVLKWMFRDRQ